MRDLTWQLSDIGRRVVLERSSSTTSRNLRKQLNKLLPRSALSIKEFLTMPPRKAAKNPQSPPLPVPSEDDDESTVRVPPQLLQRLLQEFFEEKKTRISQPALNATGEYTKTFIREAIWRAAAIRKESEQDPAGVRNMSAFLEVEDLEKLAPQLLLDF